MKLSFKYKTMQNNKYSQKFLEAASLYGEMAEGICTSYDFSDKRLRDCYRWESTGKKCPDPYYNGYYMGKKWLNYQIEEWKKGIKDGLFYLFEIPEKYHKFLT